jgi:hypothetical protein
MPKPIKTPDSMFDRTWRPGHPYRPRLTWRRRMIMVFLFLILCALIGAYQYFTNAARVREQAEQYLTKLTGGKVTVGKASLSIFQGLRLEDVHVAVDSNGSDDPTIFTAATFLIEYAPAALLQGRIEATRIVAIDPRVRLIENTKTHQWNYQQLAMMRPQSSAGPTPPGTIPEISLRNAQVEYLETGKQDSLGHIVIDGNLSPGSQQGFYSLKLQSRGGSEEMGPRADAEFNPFSGESHVILYDLKFGPDLRVMLPAQVQDWWGRHQLAGDVKKTELWVNTTTATKEFKANITLDNVAMTVQPDEILSADEMQSRQWAQQAFEAMRNVGMDDSGFVTKLSESLDAVPISLKNVDGDFTFTQDRVDINNLEATLEGNRFSINGHVDGYTNDAAASVHLASVKGRDVSIPVSPRFINSLPAEVREAYTRFRPQGTCNVWVQFDRPDRKASPNAQPQVSCEVNVTDGNFNFEKFPYPICKATGKIAVDRDPTTGEEHLRVEKIRGHGLPGGPNEKALVEIDGDMGPFTPAIEVNMTVAGKNVSSEPAMMAAFPPKTRQALAFFDAPGKGEFPKFKGDFTCRIKRAPEVVSHWDVETTIHLKDAAGSLVAFPYPMEHVTGELVIGEDHMTIKEAHVQRGDADLTVKGRVEWASDEERAKNPTTAPTLRPALTIAGHNVPIDDALINALPPMHAQWLKRMNAQGRFDLSGKLSSAPTSGMDFAFDVALHDCSMWSTGDGYALTGVGGNLKLTPTTVTLVDLKGKRGDADVTAHGQVRWPTGTPQVQMVVDAKNLALDQTLFNMVPESAQRGWAAVRPEGAVDAKITFNGVPSNESVASVVDVAPAPSTQPAAPSYEVVVSPRNVSILPTPVPYRLDDLTGTVTITPAAITMQNLAGHHGSAQIQFSGTGSPDGNGPWQLQLAGNKLLIDDDFRKAIPAGLQSVVHSLQLQGTTGFKLSSLKIWMDNTPTTNPSDQKAPDSNTDVDFAGTVNLSDSSLDPGVQLTKVTGTAGFNGSVRQGKLSDLTGHFDVPTLEVSARPASHLRADLKKRDGQDAMKLANVQAALLGGELAGQIDWTYPDTGPSRYAMALVLRNADIKTVAGDTMPDAIGQLSASLSMEGIFGDASTRRGGGDVSLNGQQLYRLPLLLGLLQVTSLSLPITSPFDEGACKYSIDGSRVTFETIDLRAKEMMVSGTGHLDFDTGRVGMTFTSKSTTNWLKVPVVTDLLQTARNELLTIHVRGTIQQPQVSGTSMNTLTTTVDEIFKGGNPPPDLAPVKHHTPPPSK